MREAVCPLVYRNVHFGGESSSYCRVQQISKYGNYLRVLSVASIKGALSCQLIHPSEIWRERWFSLSRDSDWGYLVGSIPYILLYCICWAVNMAWLSMMQLETNSKYYFYSNADTFCGLLLMRLKMMKISQFVKLELISFCQVKLCWWCSVSGMAQLSVFSLQLKGLNHVNLS